MQVSPDLGMWGFQGAMRDFKDDRGWDRRSLLRILELKSPFLPHNTGEWTECSEGWPPSGGQHDPPGRQHTDGQGGDGDQTPRHGRGCPQERYSFTVTALALLLDRWPSTHRALSSIPRASERSAVVTPAVPALGRWRQEHQKSKVILSYLVSLS